MLEEYKGYIQGTPVCSWKNGWKITSWPTASTKFTQDIMQYRTCKALIHICSSPEMGKTHYFCIYNLLPVMYGQQSTRWPRCQSGSWEQSHVHPRAVPPPDPHHQAWSWWSWTNSLSQPWPIPFPGEGPNVQGWGCPSVSQHPSSWLGAQMGPDCQVLPLWGCHHVQPFCEALQILKKGKW